MSNQNSGLDAGSSMFYVIIASAALLGAGVFPLSFLLALRYYRQLSLPLGSERHPGGALGVGGKPQQEEPKLFDVYIKPNLEVNEARLEAILPMAVRATDTDPSEKQHAGSDLPPRSQGREVHKPEASINEVTSETYDIAVLITMPTSYPRVAEHWDELGEYSIGTLKLPVTNTLDGSTYH